MAQKELKFVVKSDLREGKGLNDFLNKLAASGNKVAKQFSAMTNLSGAGKQGALVKVLQEEKKLFADVGVSAEKLTRILNTQMAQSHDKLTRNLGEANKRLKDSVAYYEKWESKVEQARRNGASSKKLSTMEAVRDAAFMRMTGLASDKAGILGEIDALGTTGKKPGALRQAMAQLLPMFPGLQALTTIALPLAAIKALGMVGDHTVGYFQNTANRAMAPYQLAAEVGQGAGRYELGRVTGNLTQSFFRQKTISDPLAAQAQSRYAEGMSDTAYYENSGIMNLVRHPINSLLSPIQTYYNHTMRNARAEAARQNGMAQFLDVQEQADPVNAYWTRFLESQSGSLYVTARRLGGTGHIYDAFSNQRSRMMDAGEQLGLKTGLVGSAGRSGLGYFGSAISSVRRGMDTGAAASLAGAGAVSGDLLEILRASGLDPTVVQEAMGRGVTQFMGPSNLLGSMDGLAASISSGVDYTSNSALQLRAIQQNIAGMGSGQTLFKGGDPWQKSVNLSNAISVLGPGANIYAQNKLANLDFGTMIGLLNGGGNLPAQWTGLGITRGSMEKYAKRTFQSTLSRFIDQGGTDEASRLARRIQGEFGGDVRAWGRSNQYSQHDAEVLAGLLSETDAGTFGGDAQALGAIRAFAGRGSAPRGVGRGKGGETTEDVIIRSVQNALDASGTEFAKKIVGAGDDFKQRVLEGIKADEDKRHGRGYTGPRLPGGNAPLKPRDPRAIGG